MKELIEGLIQIQSRIADTLQQCAALEAKKATALEKGARAQHAMAGAMSRIASAMAADKSDQNASGLAAEEPEPVTSAPAHQSDPPVSPAEDLPLDHGKTAEEDNTHLDITAPELKDFAEYPNESTLPEANGTPGPADPPEASPQPADGAKREANIPDDYKSKIIALIIQMKEKRGLTIQETTQYLNEKGYKPISEKKAWDDDMVEEIYSQINLVRTTPPD